MHTAHEEEILTQVAAAENSAGILDLSHPGLWLQVGRAGLEVVAREQRKGRLKHIRKLDLRGTGLSQDDMPLLADILRQSVGLEVLELWGNSIEDAGAETLFSIAASGVFRHLKCLQLDHTGFYDRGLAAFCNAAPYFPRLEELHLVAIEISEGTVAALARASQFLCSLRYLNCIGAEILDRDKHLREALCREPWLSTLQRFVVGRLGDVPIEALHTETPRIIRSFIAGTGDMRPLARAKLLILGQGRAGKTHLRKRICDRLPTYFDATENRTNDFDTAIWTTRYSHIDDGRGKNATLASPEDIAEPTSVCRIRILDFGGQPHLHATHRLFLSDKRCVFIIVCDATKSRSENRLDYWLRLIRNEASAASPIAIVVTKCDLYDDDGQDRLVRRLERLSTPDLRRAAQLPANSSLIVVEGVGWCPALTPQAEPARWKEHKAALRAVEKAISHLIGWLPGIGARYPQALCDVINWACNESFWSGDKWNASHVTISAFNDACIWYKLPPHLSSVALEMASNLGIVHSVRTRGPVRKGDRVGEMLFNPEWARGPVYRIINAKDVTTGRGILSWSEIESMLPDHVADLDAQEYWLRGPFGAEDRVAVVDLMIASELIFVIQRGSKEPKYFVPDHLTPRGANSVPRGQHVWCRKFEWLPEAAFGKMLGRLHQQAPQDPAALWRDEITLDVARGRVTVRMCNAGASDTGDATGNTIIYVAASGCTEREATRIVDMVDVELRAVLGEPALGPGAWTELAARGAPDTQQGARLAFTTDAVRVYDLVRAACEGGALVVASWEDVVTGARKIALLRARTNLDPDLARAVVDAERDVQRFARYCRLRGRTAWWSNRGKRVVPESAADWAGYRDRGSDGYGDTTEDLDL